MNLIPHEKFKQITRVLRQCENLTTVWSGGIFRSATPKYARSDDVVSGAGSSLYGGRWSPPGIKALYGCLDPSTAMEESLSLYRYFQIPIEQAMPRVFVAIHVSVSRILDLRRGEIRQRLKISLNRMLTEDWRLIQQSGRESVTQAVGRSAFECGYEGMLVPSRAKRGGTNLVLFPSNLQASSRVKVRDMQNDM